MLGISLLIALATQSYGIEGLSISIRNGTDVVLGWPSAVTETYIVQYRVALDTNDPWTTLTNYYPAAQYTNWTTFVIPNQICVPSGGTTGGAGQGITGGPPSPMAAIQSELAPGETLLPPLPWDPATWQFGAIATGLGLSDYVPITGDMMTAIEADVLAPQDETSSPLNTTNCPTSPGFYEVVRNGVHCVGLTNGMVLSGTVTIPLEIAAPSDDPISGAVLQVDGNMTPGGAAVQGVNNLWTFSWDTTLIPNGTHQVSADVIFGEDAADAEMTNSLTVTVSNLISFPYYYSQVFGQGTGMWVYAQSAATNVDWEVAVYDSQTNYLGYFDGYSPDGLISFTWGLQTSPYSPPLNDPTFRLDYYLWDAGTEQPLTPPSPAASKWMIGEANWDPMEMVVACSPVDGNINHTTEVQDMMIDGVINPCQSVPGGVWPQPANDPNGNAWTWGANGDGTTLMQYLPSASDLYYFGHGTPYSFGVSSNSHITYHDLVTNLHNFPGSNVPTNTHPYKLVFIDGCQSGGGPLCEAFGIPAGQYDTNFFAASALRTRAYVGYTKTISFNPDNWTQRANMLAQFWNNWFKGYHSIHYCVTNAQNAVVPMDASAVIYGATNMASFDY